MSEDHSRKQIILGLAAIFAVYGTAAYFIQTLNIARPKMAADLDGMALYSWAISLPGLAAAFVSLVFGKFSDVYGRRIMLLVSLAFFLLGTLLCAVSTTFVMLIASNVVMHIGAGAIMPLCMAALGDMYPPAERAKWIGLIHIPSGIFALFGPTLGGWFVDNLTWRHLYWMGVPILVVCIVMVPIGIPRPAKRLSHKFDVKGMLLVAVASSATILGFSYAGDKYAWLSVQIIGLLGVAFLFWIWFIRAENEAEEPVLDPQVFKNRTFLTVASASLLSFFGQVGMLMYFPLFLQGVQGLSATLSGQIITPYSVLMAFIGVPTGFLLARSRRYKWMYVLGFAILTVDMFGIILFTVDTPIWFGFLATTIAGLGLGAIPTVNTVVVQNAVPKKLLGVAMGATFFCIMMGIAISPAILGSAMNVTYAKKLAVELPGDLADAATMTSLQGNPRVLLDEEAMSSLEESFKQQGAGGEARFRQTVEAIRVSLEAGLRSVFWIGAIMMLLSFLIICTVPKVSLKD